MDEIIEKTLLFDFYSDLLTENQKKIYTYYHLDDLSLSEISEQMKISRQGVFDSLKRSDHQLKNFEDKLQLVKKFESNRLNMKKIYKIALEIKNMDGLDAELLDKIHMIERISSSLLEDL